MTATARNRRYTAKLAEAARILDAFAAVLKPGCLGTTGPKMNDLAADLRNYAMHKPYADRLKFSKS